MVRAYLNVRATGGAVASSPYRGNRWSSEKRVKLASTFSSRDRGRRSQTWWGECFLWFVSFAPKEMNITFGSFPKQASLNLGEDLNTGFLRFDYSNGAI